MTCEETQNLLDPYVDGELDWSSNLAIESHLQGCPLCSCVLASLKVLVSVMQRGAPKFKAPLHLKSTVLSGIERANPAVRHSFVDWRWVTLAASIIVIAALSWLVATRTAKPSLETQLIGDIVSNHVRSLMAAGQEIAAPSLLACIGSLGGDDHERRQVAVLGAQGEAGPGAQARPRDGEGAGVDPERRLGVVRVVRVHGADEADVVHAGAHVREELAHLGAARGVGAELEWGARQELTAMQARNQEIVDAQMLRLVELKRDLEAASVQAEVSRVAAESANREAVAKLAQRAAAAPEPRRHDPGRNDLAPEFAAIEAALAGSPPVPAWERIA